MDRRDFLKSASLAVLGPSAALGSARIASALVGGGVRRYSFDRTISLEVLNNYLSRAVSHYGLCSISPEPSSAFFEDDMRMLTDLGAKFVGRAAYAWVPPDDEEAHFRQAEERSEQAHKADPDMILQACVFEAVYTSVDRIPVPAWVFEEFRLPFEKRTFRYADMLYDGGKLRDHWTTGASVPDVSKPETRLYFFYRARRYVDCGFESIHFGQVHLMDHNDPGHRAWHDLLTRLRRYAARNSRRRMVLCDAHTHGVVIGGTHLLFDFHAWPLMAQDVAGKPQNVELLDKYYNSIYGRSEGGFTPSGWYCNWLPYICEFDCGGVSDKPGQPSSFPWNWGYACGDWFAHQPEAYRNDFLRYARKWLSARKENAWLQMPTRLNLGIPIAGNKMWHANRKSSACPVGFGLEKAIKAVWESEDR